MRQKVQCVVCSRFLVFVSISHRNNNNNNNNNKNNKYDDVKDEETLLACVCVGEEKYMQDFGGET